MSDQQTSGQQPQSVDFLLAEYRYLGGCFWRNEEAGERRVNFLITFVTAVAVGLVTLATSKKGDGFLEEDDVYLITVYVLLVLLSIGLVTLLRMIHRNQVTDKYKQVMNTIRSHFREPDSWLQDYYPFGKGEGKDKVETRQPGTGGLADLVSLINSLIVAALCALLTRSWPGWSICLVGLLVLVTVLIVHSISCYKEGSKERAMRKSGRIRWAITLVISLILAALCTLLAYFQLAWGIVLSGLVGFSTALIVQFIYAKHRYMAGDE